MGGYLFRLRGQVDRSSARGFLGDPLRHFPRTFRTVIPVEADPAGCGGFEGAAAHREPGDLLRCGHSRSCTVKRAPAPVSRRNKRCCSLLQWAYVDDKA